MPAFIRLTLFIFTAGRFSLRHISRHAIVTPRLSFRHCFHAAAWLIATAMIGFQFLRWPAAAAFAFLSLFSLLFTPFLR